MSQNSTDQKGTKIETMAQAQYSMQKAYAGGALGALVSGSVWLVAAIVAFWVSSQTAVWTLFFGGMLIHPLGMVVGKLAGFSGQHDKGNPLGQSAMEGTLFMLLCIPLALLLSFQNHAWFFQGMLLIIGGRYLTFATLYGNKTYWFLGGVLGAAAFLLFFIEADAAISALSGSTIEIFFGIVLFAQFRRGNT
jgi:hypothetical protein